MPSNKEDADILILPEEVKKAFEAIEVSLENNYEHLRVDLKEALGQVSTQYKGILSKFYSITKPTQKSTAYSGRVNFLKHIKLFKGLNEVELGVVSQKMQEFLIEEGQAIITQNEPTDGVYFLVDGVVEIIVNNELITRRGKGEYFGEMSSLKGEEPASATVRGGATSKILKIPSKTFLGLVNRKPQLWKNIFLATTSRFKDISNRLSEILSHTPQGLIKVDPKGVITNEYTIQCTQYFEINDLMGRKFAEVALKTDDDAREGWTSIYPLIFEDDLMEFSELAELMPAETRLEFHSGKVSYFNLKYYPCYDDNDVLIAVDVSIEDITIAKNLSFKSEALENERAIMECVYENPLAFLNILRMIDTTKSCLEAFSTQAATKTIEYESVFMVDLMRELHSLKGSSAMFKLTELSASLHEMEEAIKLIRQDKSYNEIHKNHYMNAKADFDSATFSALNIMSTMNQELKNRLTGVVLSKEEFEKLKNAVKTKEMGGIEELIGEIEKIPITKLCILWPKEINRLADKLGKEIHFKITGENIPISSILYRKLEASLLHIIRNCADHGIEDKERRIEQGKPAHGTITLNTFKKDNNLVIEILDDGAGIDEKSLIASARSNAQLDQSMVEGFVDKGRAWEILFIEGVSTKTQASDISGRGIGLNAVASTVKELNGTIEVYSVPHNGTTFAIEIPF